MKGHDNHKFEDRLGIYRKNVQSLLEYCLYCQPYEDGEPDWILGERTDIEDLFSECNVPEEFIDGIMSQLRCPHCGNREFNIAMEVGTKTKFEKEIEAHIDEATGIYGSEVRELESLLEDYPLLAYSNDFAKSIFNDLEKRNLPITSIKGNFFRARKVESSDVLDSKNLCHPPLGKSLEGRFNHAGQSHLYFASDKNTAIKEVVSDCKQMLVWYQEFVIEKELNMILDLSFDWMNLSPSTSTLLLSLKLFDTIGRTDRNNENWRPDYCLTRYIMDCAKKLGYNGIKYNSTKNSSTYNLVLFSPERIEYAPLHKPEVYVFMEKENERKIF